MRKAGYGSLKLAFAFVLLAVVVFLPSGAGLGALDREMAFSGGLHNSLYHLDQAKWKWAAENKWKWEVENRKSKKDVHVPEMTDLAPYLRGWTNSIQRLITLGIAYRITPISEDEEPQSDVATLTRDLHFRSGFCRFYVSGTRYSVRTGWAVPEYGSTSRIRAFYFNNRELVAAGLLMFGFGCLLVFAAGRIRRSRLVIRVTHGHQNA